MLSRNVYASTLSSLRDRLDRIRAAYRDVKPGDRYALTYRPGSGTELSFNGTTLVVIQGDDFAAAYFSIWLGKQPLDRGLRKTCSGKARVRRENDHWLGGGVGPGNDPRGVRGFNTLRLR